MSLPRVADPLRRLDSNPIRHAADSVVACVVLRNEVSRIPHLLDHHRRLGVRRFFIVDNGSEDGSIEVLLDQPDVHLWSTSGSFREANYGAHWFEAILREHAPDNWVVIVDADELLWFDECETRSIDDLCAELEGAGHRAAPGVLLDLYPQGPLAEAQPSTDRSPLETSRWFDRRWYHGISDRSGPHQDQIGVFGGVRRRLFGGNGWDYCLSKVPLLRFGPDVELVGGQHWTELPLAADRVAVLHIKLDARLVDLAWTELERGERATHSQEYLAYAECLALHPQLGAFDPAESIEFTGSAVLRELGIIGPIEDPAASRTRVRALMTQADVRLDSGDARRATALLERAAAIEPTGVGPLLRLAAMHRVDGDVDAAARTFDEAIARRPDDLGILTIASEAPPLRPRWWSEADAAIRAAGIDVSIITDIETRFTCTPDFGFARPRPESPWIGITNAATPIADPGMAPDESIAVSSRHHLDAMWGSPEFHQSLPSCRALITFTEDAADWMRRRTSTPVLVARLPIEPSSDPFDLDALLGSARRTLVQPGLLDTDLNAIVDLPIGPTSADRARTIIDKVRCVPAAQQALAIAIARAQRRTTSDRVSIDALRATTDLGGVDEATITELLRTSLVLADLLAANADPILVSCISSGTPLLVSPLPAVVELLGPDYPLLFTSLPEAAGLALDDDAITAAHHRLMAIRTRHSTSAFLAVLLHAAGTDREVSGR